MKKLFALFCAVFLMPTFSAHAWIGGPFSNNSYFGEDGDDGVYEAVAFPIASPRTPGIQNGIGVFRWAVTNNKAFSSDVTSTITRVVFDDQGNIDFTFVDVVPLTSNVYFGGVGQVGHSWFIEGISYRGNSDGIVNSGLGVVSATGIATDVQNQFASVSSSFKARFEGSGQGIPISRFSGIGSGSTTNALDPTANIRFRFIVFGSKVSSQVTYNGVSG